MKRHLPYNVLLIATVITIGLMMVFNITLRQSGFAVRVGYAVPEPPPAASAAPAPRPNPQSAPPAAQQSPPAQQPQLVYEPEPVILARFPLELNSATYEQLQLIPGIGPVMSQRIIDHRRRIDGFTHMSQLLDVSGIGVVTFERITAYLYLENQIPLEVLEEPYRHGEDDYFYYNDEAR